MAAGHEPVERWERHPGAASSPLGRYRRREPEKTLLHAVVRERLEPFLAAAGRAEAAPAYPPTWSARFAQLPRLRNPGPRIRSRSLPGLRVRAAGRLLLQGPRLPLVRDAADGGRCRAPRSRRHPRGAGPPVGALVTATAPVPGRAEPGPRLQAPGRLHPSRVRVAAEGRAANGGGRSADRRRHVRPALRRRLEPERPLSHARPGRRLRRERRRPRALRQAARAADGGGGGHPGPGDPSGPQDRDHRRGSRPACRGRRLRRPPGGGGGSPADVSPIRSVMAAEQRTSTALAPCRCAGARERPARARAAVPLRRPAAVRAAPPVQRPRWSARVSHEATPRRLAVPAPHAGAAPRQVRHPGPAAAVARAEIPRCLRAELEREGQGGARGRAAGCGNGHAGLRGLRPAR